MEEAKRGQLERKYVWVTADGYPFGSEEPPPPPPLEEERRKLVATVPSAPPLVMVKSRPCNCANQEVIRALLIFCLAGMSA
eukprot:COSAG06_NODE_2164_length_7436_cov_5.989778_5_plen_81_part_00